MTNEKKAELVEALKRALKEANRPFRDAQFVLEEAINSVIEELESDEQ